MVPVRMWQWQYWQCCGCLKVTEGGKKKCAGDVLP
jgi:hypothetical protein